MNSTMFHDYDDWIAKASRDKPVVSNGVRWASRYASSSNDRSEGLHVYVQANSVDQRSVTMHSNERPSHQDP
jgi:hypothetical protein